MYVIYKYKQGQSQLGNVKNTIFLEVLIDDNCDKYYVKKS